MKFTAVVDKVLPHDRFTGQGVTETYKNVVHLIVTDEAGAASATQPISRIAGTIELHIPAGEGWDEAQPGLPVTVTIETVKPKAKEAAASAKPAAKPKSKAKAKTKATTANP